MLHRENRKARLYVDGFGNDRQSSWSQKSDFNFEPTQGLEPPGGNGLYDHKPIELPSHITNS